MKILLIVFVLMLAAYLLFQLMRKKNMGKPFLGSFFRDTLMILAVDLMVCTLIVTELPYEDRLVEEIPVQNTTKDIVPEHGGTYTYMDCDSNIKKIKADTFVKIKTGSVPMLKCYSPKYTEQWAEDLCGDFLKILMNGNYSKVEILR